MNQKNKEILAKALALLHGCLTAYIIVTIIWFLITFKMNVYVIAGLALAVWVLAIQKWVIGGCPLTFIENRLKGYKREEKFMVRFWGFFGIKVKDNDRTWKIFKWGSIGLFAVVVIVRLCVI